MDQNQTLPIARSQYTHLSIGNSQRLARASGANDVVTVASYLCHCYNERDAADSIASLRTNVPSLWAREGKPARATRGGKW
jgi:hypothetical protein